MSAGGRKWVVFRVLGGDDVVKVYVKMMMYVCVCVRKEGKEEKEDRNAVVMYQPSKVL